MPALHVAFAIPPGDQSSPPVSWPPLSSPLPLDGAPAVGAGDGAGVLR